MLAIKEITVWKGISRQPNHTYLMDGDKIIAYKQWHTGEPIYSKTPLRMDKRYRKFVEVEVSQFKNIPQVASNTKTVQGSKGNTYTVNLDTNTCSCPGFTFRGKCKHIEE